jgi:hypothetical protein
MENEKYEIARLVRKFIIDVLELTPNSYNKFSKNEINEFSIESIEENIKVDFFEKKDSLVFYLKPEFEDLIFQNIFEYSQHEEFYHYTSFQTLFAILNSNSIQMSAISGMNDKSEMIFPDELLGINTALDSKKIEAMNRRFIMCFTDQRDHLNQWRLYGDNGAGVAIGFKYKSPKLSKHYLVFGKVFYGHMLFQLMSHLIADIWKTIGCKFRFRRIYLWKNFVKVEDYREESETRLLQFNRERTPKFKSKHSDFKVNSYGILTPYVTFKLNDENLPLELTEVILGPKCSEGNLNLEQLNYFKNKKKLKFNISKSLKTHYR